MAMSFKCSVFGHAYGDAEIERNREEDGSEVITTIRETQTCKRCGEERIVSENKEVTTLETAADIVAEDLEEQSEGEPAEEPDTSPTPAPEPTEKPTDAEIIDAESDAPVAEESPPAESPAPDSESQPPAEEPPAAPAGATTQDAGGFDTAEPEPDPETDDGVILDEDDEDEERDPGEWPDEPGDGGDDWKPETDVDPTPEEPTVEPTASAVSVPDGEFHCPECEFTTPVEESSLRAGDFCPECHRGSLEHVSE